MKDELSQAIVRLFEQERFYAELIFQMDRYIGTKVSTLGVCIKDRIQLHVNPDFFVSLSNGQKNDKGEALPDEQVAVLKHECKHILNDHISRAKDLAPEVYANKGDAIDSLINGAKHQLINVAADCSINPGIPCLPKDTMLPNQFGLDDGHLMEWYVANLKDNEKLKNLTEVDGHSLWGESDGEKEEIKEKIKRAILTAAKNTKAAGGYLSADIETIIDRLSHQSKDWRSDLRRFAARTQEIALVSSKKKRNRRYGILYPGVVKEETLHIGVAVDTSGSISDEALCQFFAEIGNMAKYAKITVVEADSEVKNSYVFDPKKQYKASGRGGTAYQPALDYFSSETDVDGVIYLGDMDNYDSEQIKKPKYPILWAIIGKQKPPADFGSVTYVEVKQK